MRTCTYDDILRGVCDLMGWDPDNLDSYEFHQVKRAVSKSLERIWRLTAGARVHFSDVGRCEQRQMRATYDATLEYTTGAEVYFPGTDAYYVAIRTAESEAPATQSGNEWETNVAYWAEAETVTEAEDFDATETYEVGDQVFYPQDGLVYQMHTAAVAGTLPSVTAAWGPVPPFLPYIPRSATGWVPIGDIIRVSSVNPKVNPGASKLPYRLERTGIELFDLDVPRPWVWFLTRPHRFTGDIYSAAVAYTPPVDDDATGGGVSGGGGATSATDTSGTGYAGGAALRARTEHTSNQIAYLIYAVTSGDGGGGWFRFNTASTAADDAADTWRPDDISIGNPGRWERVT